MINFKLPDLLENYGQDWSDFLDITTENNDYNFNKIWELYYLVDIDRMPLQVLESLLRNLKINYDAADSFQIKKILLRSHAGKYINKGLDIIYIEAAKSITGLDGVLHNFDSVGYMEWGQSIWPDTSSPSIDDWVWAEMDDLYIIYFDVKTLDNDELDDIQRLLQDETLKPAFYKMYLIDSNFIILRTI